MITNETLKDLNANSNVEGAILCKSYSIALTKNGKEYITGTLQSGVEIPFKIWGDAPAFMKLKTEEYTNQVVYVVGSVNDFQGTRSIIVTEIQAITDYTIDNFLPTKYDVEAYLAGLKQMVSTYGSEKCMELANEVLFNNAERIEAFKIEFAAKSHHDNCKGGLLAHTYKVVSFVGYFTKLYRFFETQDDIDLVIFGALVHDIGKLQEMHLGVYTKESFVTHRYLGIEMMPKDKIVSLYSEEWWLKLVSIFLQHHGEFEDKCKTKEAYIVNQADLLDANMTFLIQSMENPIISEAGKRVKVDNTFLTI